MGIEIERKFLLKDSSWKKSIFERHEILQGYLSLDSNRSVRVRIVDNESAFLTIKGKPSNKGIQRDEFEYEIPLEDAKNMTGMFLASISKTRNKVRLGGLVFEIDEFQDSNLVLAEVELASTDQEFEKPSWLGKEVTGEKEYYNLFLAISNMAFQK